MQASKAFFRLKVSLLKSSTNHQQICSFSWTQPTLQKHLQIPTFNTSLNPGGGGPLEYQGGYQARPKIHVIRAVFQDQALYARTAFRGAKTCKIGKKGVFLVI